MTTVQHSDLSTGVIHIVYNWTYANAAARTGAGGFVSGDIGKLARQTDNDTLWMLTATTPTWVAVGSGGGGSGNVTSNAVWASPPGTPASGDLWFPSDANYTARYNGASWDYYYKGIHATPVDQASYTWVNQRSATASSAHGGIYLTTPADAGHKELLTKARPSTPPWSVTTMLELALGGSNNNTFLLGFRESSTGKLVDVAVLNNGGVLSLLVTHWSDANTFVAVDLSQTTIDVVARGPIWVKIKDDNTNLVFSWSIDGFNFIQFGTVGRTAYLAGGANQYYFGMRSDTLTSAAFIVSAVEGT